MRDRGGSIAPDPVGEFYAWLTRGFVSVRDVGFGFPLFFALLIEVVSAFGPLTIAAYAEASRPGDEPTLMARHGSPWPALTGSGGPWLGTSNRKTDTWCCGLPSVPHRSAATAAIGIEELHADYAAWCAERGLRAGSVAFFEAEFDRVRDLPDLAGKIRKFGDRYYGVGLVRRNRRAIASARRG